ncbi:MAG: ThiF family adenylyltransferase [archaeon]|nr:ThiF family adenylyltransferase [archaeon]
MSLDKYDRQTRLWSEGQILISNASVLCIGSDSLATEILKNLILSGIHKVTILDDAIVNENDTKLNFFVSPEDIGKERAHIVLTHLLELNSDVRGESYNPNLNQFLTNEENCKQFEVIVLANQPKKTKDKFMEIAKKFNIRLISANTNGLFGLISIYENYHANMKLRLLENPVNDHRLATPWTELKEFCLGFNLKDMDEITHKHIPYYVILVQALEELRKKKNNENFNPKTKAEKDEFKEIIKSMQKFNDEDNFNEAMSHYYFCNADSTKLITDKLSYIFSEITDETIDIVLNKSNTIMKVFFIYCLSLKEFYEKNKTFPVVGNIPDMTADTQSYINLKRVYQKKAEQDKEEIKKIILKKIGEISFDEKETVKQLMLNPEKDYIDFVDILTKNWPQISLFKYINERPFKLVLDQFDEEYQKLNLKYFILFKASEFFFEDKGRYPGVDSNWKEDVSSLNDYVEKVKSLISDANGGDIPCKDVEEQYVFEFCRNGFSFMPPVVSMIGDMTSQEIIKLITYQFETVKNTILYNGVDVTLTSFQA